MRSILEPLGPTLTIGPNNFPFAFHGAGGGDFAAAVAAGCPVIAKGHPGHPATSRDLAALMTEAADAAGLPPGWAQFFQHCAPEDGLRLVRDPRIAAVAFTGSQRAGLALKAACDETGTVGHFEMGSVNPVFVLPGALAERGGAIVEELAASALLGGGQFCTQPGLVVLPAGEATTRFAIQLQDQFDAAPTPPLLSRSVVEGLESGVKSLEAAGANALPSSPPDLPPGFRYPSTVLAVSGGAVPRSSGRASDGVFRPGHAAGHADGRGATRRDRPRAARATDLHDPQRHERLGRRGVRPARGDPAAAVRAVVER